MSVLDNEDGSRWRELSSRDDWQRLVDAEKLVFPSEDLYTVDEYLEVARGGWKSWVLETTDGQWLANVQIGGEGSVPPDLRVGREGEVPTYLASLMVIDRSREGLADRALSFGLSRCGSTVLTRTRADNHRALGLLARSGFWPCRVDEGGQWRWFVRSHGHAERTDDQVAVDRTVTVSIIRPFWLLNPHLLPVQGRLDLLSRLHHAWERAEGVDAVHRSRLPGYLSPSVRLRRHDQIMAGLDPSEISRGAADAVGSSGLGNHMWATVSVRYFDYGLAWIEQEHVVSLDAASPRLIGLGEQINEATRDEIDRLIGRVVGQSAGVVDEGLRRSMIRTNGEWAGRSFTAYAINLSMRTCAGGSREALIPLASPVCQSMISRWTGVSELEGLDDRNAPFVSFAGREGQVVVLREPESQQPVEWQWRLAVAMWGMLDHLAESLLGEIEGEWADRDEELNTRSNLRDRDLASFTSIIQREADPVYAIGDSTDEKVYETIWANWKGDALSKSTLDLVNLYRSLRTERSDIVRTRQTGRIEALLFFFGAVSATATMAAILQIWGVERNPPAAIALGVVAGLLGLSAFLVRRERSK